MRLEYEPAVAGVFSPSSCSGPPAESIASFRLQPYFMAILSLQDGGYERGVPKPQMSYNLGRSRLKAIVAAGALLVAFLYPPPRTTFSDFITPHPKGSRPHTFRYLKSELRINYLFQRGIGAYRVVMGVSVLVSIRKGRSGASAGVCGLESEAWSGSGSCCRWRAHQK